MKTMLQLLVLIGCMATMIENSDASLRNSCRRSPMLTFKKYLQPHGTWMWVREYGWVWEPRVSQCDPYWRPFQDNGRWKWSDDGWTWSSCYSWGWAPFHYGKWVYSSSRRWLWIPDTHYRYGRENRITYCVTYRKPECRPSFHAGISYRRPQTVRHYGSRITHRSNISSCRIEIGLDPVKTVNSIISHSLRPVEGLLFGHSFDKPHHRNSDHWSKPRKDPKHEPPPHHEEVRFHRKHSGHRKSWPERDPDIGWGVE